MNPYAVHIHTDGASDYDRIQTGGIGFVIEFPDTLNLEPIKKYFNVNEQGIQRLEMICIIHAMDKLLNFCKANPSVARQVSGGVIIHTDRFNITDTELNNPYRVDSYRKNGWRNYENKPIKNSELLDQIDKKRKKLSFLFSGRVEINYEREKKNKTADKLSKLGKASQLQTKKVAKKQLIKRGKRLFNGSEVNYHSVSIGDMVVHVYLKNPVDSQFEMSCDICDGELKGHKIKIYVDCAMEKQMHRRHCYEVKITKVCQHHILITHRIKEVKI